MLKIPSAGTTVGRRARTHSLSALTGLLLTLALALGALPARGQELAVTLRLTPMADSGVSGTAALAALGEGSALVALAVVGLEPGARYGSVLNAGTCDQRSASGTYLVPLEADAAGAATAIGSVRWRGVEDIPLPVLTDGHHIIVIIGAGGAVACGSIPAVTSTPTGG